MMVVEVEVEVSGEGWFDLNFMFSRPGRGRNSDS